MNSYLKVFVTFILTIVFFVIALFCSNVMNEKDDLISLTGLIILFAAMIGYIYAVLRTWKLLKKI